MVQKNRNPHGSVNHSFYKEKDVMERILSTLNSGLVLLDPDMTVFWANEMIEKMFPGKKIYGEKCYVVAENRSELCEDCQ